MGYLDALEGAHSRTAFRSAEKLYKRYKQTSTHVGASKSRHGRKVVPPTDLSKVLDFRKYADATGDASRGFDGVSLSVGAAADAPVFVIDGHPGFYFIPQALSIEEQCCWIRESLTSFPQPPNRTNHYAMYGHISDLWAHAQDQHILVEGVANDRDNTEKSHLKRFPEPRGNGATSCRPHRAVAASAVLAEETTLEAETHRPAEHMVSSKGKSDMSAGRDPDVSPTRTGRSPLKARVVPQNSAEENNECWLFVDESEVVRSSSRTNAKSVLPTNAKSLLRRLRWATIGLQFDWSEKGYNTGLPYRELSPELSNLAERLARMAFNEVEFKAEAAIVNYYGPDDMLGGHVDDMEADWSKPIVSISLGCKAVFLLGGESRDDAPVAMFLRSGDAVLMAGPARRCFHGVPRIFVDADNSDVPDFSTVTQLLASPFREYIQQSRININVRQVH